MLKRFNWNKVLPKCHFYKLILLCQNALLNEPLRAFLSHYLCWECALETKNPPIIPFSKQEEHFHIFPARFLDTFLITPITRFYQSQRWQEEIRESWTQAKMCSREGGSQHFLDNPELMWKKILFLIFLMLIIDKMCGLKYSTNTIIRVNLIVSSFWCSAWGQLEWFCMEWLMQMKHGRGFII